MTDYDHKCPDCGVEFSVKWDIEELTPIQHCPHCGYFLQKDKTIEEMISSDG